MILCKENYHSVPTVSVVKNDLVLTSLVIADKLTVIYLQTTLLYTVLFLTASMYINKQCGSDCLVLIAENLLTEFASYKLHHFIDFI